MKSQLIIRIDSDLKDKINYLAQNEGKNVSSVVRDLLVQYVKEKDISEHIEDIWNEIGSDLRKKKISVEDIDQIITSSRKK